MATGGLKLYVSAASPFCHRVEIAAREKEAAPERVAVGLHDAMYAWCKEIHPRETVPAVFAPAGEAVHESLLIAQYVDSIATEGDALAPRGDAGKEYEVGFFVDNVGDYVNALFALVLCGEDGA